MCGSTLIYDDRQPAGHVRTLTHYEVWKTQGGTQREWDQLQGTTDSAEYMRLALRALNPGTATGVLHSLETHLQSSPAPVKAGLCFDPDDELCHQELSRWLAAWRVNPQEPKTELAACVATAEAKKEDTEPIDGALSPPPPTKAGGPPLEESRAGGGKRGKQKQGTEKADQANFGQLIAPQGDDEFGKLWDPLKKLKQGVEVSLEQFDIEALGTE